jgi:hypothetical protein
MKTNGPEAPDQAPLAWPRVLCSLLGLVLLAWGFNGIYARPLPTSAELAVFCFLLVLIFLETVQAGWYRRTELHPAQQERKPVARETGPAELARKSKGQ